MAFSDNERYGPIQLGEIQAFLRDIVGDDELYILANEEMEKHEIPYKEKDSCRKSWDRYCKEETKNKEKVQDYIDYSINSKDSIFYLFYKFKNRLKTKYNFDSLIFDFIIYFSFFYYESLKKFNFDKEKQRFYMAGEGKTNSLSCLILIKSIAMWMGMYRVKNGGEKTKILLKDIVLCTYRDLFEQLRTELGCKSLEKLYEKLGYDSSKKIISKAIKTDLSPAWKSIENLINSCSEELKNKFIFKFLLQNTIESAKCHLLITAHDISLIKNIFLTYSETNTNFDYKEFIDNLFGKLKEEKGNPLFFDGKNCHSALPLTIYKNIYDKNLHKKIDKKQISSLIDLLTKEAFEIAPFFVPWFKALVLIAERDFTKEKYEDTSLLNATKLFDEAFDNKYLAGDFIKEFLEQGFVLENYVNSSFSLTTRAYKYDGINEKQKNPVTCNAKKFLNFGYAIGLFPENAEESSFKALSANELFNQFFPSSFFVSEKDAEKKYQEEFENDNYIEIEDIQFIYDKLSALSASKRNNLVFIKDIISKDSKHNPKQKQLYPPLNICIQYGLYDEKLLDLAIDWLEGSENPINTTKVSYTGQTALCVAFLVYKYFRLQNITVGKITKIIDMLIEKTDFESELQFSERISTLTYAIDAFNLEYVQKLTEKIPEDKFQDYRLYKNNSPLMYAINRKQPVSLGFEEFIRTKKDNNIPILLYPQGLNFTREEKVSEFEYFNPHPKDIDEYWYHHDQKEKEITQEDFDGYSKNYGTPENPNLQVMQVEQLDKIIDYFISKTEDVDYFRCFFRSSDDGMLCCTSLIYAGQHNDVDTCRKLLARNAIDSSEEYGFYSYKYGESKYLVQNNFINNLCLFKSWETLIMIFDEYPELIKKSLFSEPPFVNSYTLFAVVIKNRFIWAGKEKREYKDIAEYLIGRFCEAGADSTQESVIGSVKAILSGIKILKGD